MKIELRSLDSITPYERNPRKNDGAVVNLERAMSIRDESEGLFSLIGGDA